MSRKAKELETDTGRSSAQPSREGKTPSRVGRAAGPRTAAGKRRSSQNAVKHGLFSKNGLPPSVQWERLPAQYRTLYRNLVKNLRPETALEMMTVEVLASSFYRWRAAAHLQNQLVAELRLDVPRETCIPEEVRMEVIRQYWRTLPPRSRLGLLMGLPDQPGLRLPAGVPREELGPDPTEPSPADEYAPEGVHNPLRNDPDEREFMRKLVQAMKALPESQSKPPDIQVDPAFRLREENRRTELLNELLDKLQRYEAHLWRIFLRALNEFERLQRMRLGQPIPPPIEVNVTA